MVKPKILVLGGTQLLGRDFIENSLSKETFDITIANRGITNPDLFTNIPYIRYDRNIDNTCSQFKNLAYDYVIDFSCYTLTQFLNTWKYFIDVFCI
jgi:hypothetical protein